MLTKVQMIKIGDKVYVPAQARSAVVLRKGLKADFISPKRGLIIVDQIEVKFEDGRIQRVEYDCIKELV